MAKNTVTKEARQLAKRDAQIAMELSHAGDCVVRSIQMAINAPSGDDAQRYAESAVRFVGVCKRSAWLLELI